MTAKQLRDFLRYYFDSKGNWIPLSNLNCSKKQKECLKKLNRLIFHTNYTNDIAKKYYTSNSSYAVLSEVYDKNINTIKSAIKYSNNKLLNILEKDFQNRFIEDDVNRIIVDLDEALAQAKPLEADLDDFMYLMPEQIEQLSSIIPLSSLKQISSRELEDIQSISLKLSYNTLGVDANLLDTKALQIIKTALRNPDKDPEIEKWIRRLRR